MSIHTPLHLSDKKSDIWNTISKRLHAAPELELFLDYDGTITPIRKTPSEAVLAPDTIQLLQQLIQLPDMRLTIVTGRSMKDIRSLIPLENIRFIANHGFHIYQGETEWTHPDASSFRPRMQQLQNILKNALEQYPKVFVEDKQFTLSIHFRNAPTQDIPSIKEVTRKTIASFDPKLFITEGKEVLEVRPPIKWGKGHAVMEILKGYQPPARSLQVYIGDDMTDEDAFQVFPSSGITIHVGEISETYAQYYVSDVDEVLQILKTIIKLRSHRSNHHKTS